MLYEAPFIFSRRMLHSRRRVHSVERSGEASCRRQRDRPDDRAACLPERCVSGAQEKKLEDVCFRGIVDGDFGLRDSNRS